MTVFFVLISVIVSLIASAILLHSYVLRSENNVVKEKLRNTARMITKDSWFINEVTGN